MPSPRFALACAAMLLSPGCAGLPRFGEPLAQPEFSPAVFFTGKTEGRGVLRTMMRHAQPVAVHGSGQVAADGTLVLTQIVERAGKPPKTREWRLRETAPGHYAGTLSDAIGPVSGARDGDRLHLAFAAKGGLRVQQWLTLAPDGQSARNLMQVRKMGVLVAVLDETIARTGE